MSLPWLCPPPTDRGRQEAAACPLEEAARLDGQRAQSQFYLCDRLIQLRVVLGVLQLFAQTLQHLAGPAEMFNGLRRTSLRRLGCGLGGHFQTPSPISIAPNGRRGAQNRMANPRNALRAVPGICNPGSLGSQ